MAPEDRTEDVEIQAGALAPERARTLEYLRSRAAALSATALRARVRAAGAELEGAAGGLTEAEARGHLRPGEWSVAEIVDHVAQTTIRAAEELRHVLSGRRPPAPPVYEALTSGAAVWVPWAELLDGLRAALAELDALLDAATRLTPEATAVLPSIPTVLVVSRTPADGRAAAEPFVAELDWKEYALVQRLHLLDHRSQVRELRAASGR